MMRYRIQQESRAGHFDLIPEPFIVPTPQPYVVDLSRNRDHDQREQAKKFLLESCALLYEILAMLNISLYEAHQKNYSLNRQTADALLDIAIALDRRDAADKIRSRDW